MDSKFEKFKRLGDRALEKGEYAEALQYFDRAVYIDQKNSIGWTRKAAAEIYLQNYDDALKSADEALKLDRKNADAWFNRGLVLDKRRKYESALNSYDNALRYNTKHVKALNNKGTILGQLERFDEAEKCFKQVLEFDSKNEDANENLKLLADYRAGKHKRRCFIATAAYGTPFEPKINTLRRWRDYKLNNTYSGKTFIEIYYRLSPTISSIISRHDILKSIVRSMLEPLIILLSKKSN
jgi:tetratricopeptide (TPR) repeat protein